MTGGLVRVVLGRSSVLAGCCRFGSWVFRRVGCWAEVRDECCREGSFGLGQVARYRIDSMECLEGSLADCLAVV